MLGARSRADHVRRTTHRRDAGWSPSLILNPGRGMRGEPGVARVIVVPTDHAMPNRDYEEALRSLGRLFDEQALEDVLLVERTSGFLVTGLQRAQPHVLVDEPRSRFEYVESTYPYSDIDAASVAGVERRGSGHRADRNEGALRLIGRHVNERGGSRILVVDQGDGFVLRMLLEADADMPHRFDTITSGQLDRMREQALEARRIQPAGGVEPR